jgi:hypothetical protein
MAVLMNVIMKIQFSKMKKISAGFLRRDQLLDLFNMKWHTNFSISEGMDIYIYIYIYIYILPAYLQFLDKLITLISEFSC